MLVEVHLSYVRSSQGLCRYIEGRLEEQEGVKKEVLVEHPLVGVIYLSKARLGAKPPKGIRLVVEAVQEQEGSSDATN